MKRKSRKGLRNSKIHSPITVDNKSADALQEPNISKQSSSTRGMDFKLVLQVFAILISIIAISVTIYFNFRKEENEKASITVQMGIQPTDQLDSLGKHRYYESWYLFMNSGKATTKVCNITWFLNNHYLEYSSKPFIIGSNHGVEINVIETSTPGFCEMKIKDLPPNVGFMVGVRHKIKNIYVNEIYEEWQQHMFDRVFTEHFLSGISVSGEKIDIKNGGFADLKNMQKE